MYVFHYHYIKNKYDNKLKLFFTESNSLTYEIKTEYVYEDFSNDKEIFDFSNYPLNRTLTNSLMRKYISKTMDLIN